MILDLREQYAVENFEQFLKYVIRSRPEPERTRLINEADLQLVTGTDEEEIVHFLNIMEGCWDIYFDECLGDDGNFIIRRFACGESGQTQG